MAFSNSSPHAPMGPLWNSPSSWLFDEVPKQPKSRPPCLPKAPNYQVYSPKIPQD